MAEPAGIEDVIAVHGRQATHWRGCWRVHHQCAIVLLERILASDTWAAECAEFGCTDPDHSSR